MEQHDFRDEKKRSVAEKGYIRRKSIMDWGMGILWIGMGVFMLFIKYFDTDLKDRYDDPNMKMFGAVCLLYGTFRIYRGIRKNYFTE